MNMKKYISKKIIVIITISFVVIIAASFSSHSVSVVPVVNSANGCALTSTKFNSWFNSGSVTLNGIVRPFVSNDFPEPSDSPSDCDFFQWSEQTFLWLTSPSRLENTNSGDIAERIFESPAFYDVSPPDADGNRKFIPHEQGKIRVFSLRDAQVGPNKMPVVFEKKTGRMLEIEKAPVSAKGLPLIINKAGEQTEIVSMTMDNAMKPVLKDNSGKVIQTPKPVVSKRPEKKFIVYKYTIGGRVVYFDANGNNIEVEAGQADGGDVLMSQNNSLVYYSISVNQLYALTLTAYANEALEGPNNGPNFNNSNTRFFESFASPKIIEYGAAHGKIIRYPEAATIEIKCSWVEAASLPDASKYIKMKAIIPVYFKSSGQWIPQGQKTVELAMVGMHIAGRVRWWPDMLWATFEHINNTPNAAYSTSSKVPNSGVSGKTLLATYPQNTSGIWNFCANGSNGPFNASRMHTEGNKIVANSGSTIGPSNIIRWKPWGTGGNDLGTNSDIKTLNSSVRGMLMDGDVRKNYIQIGTTWREDVENSPQKGSTRLANTTMETFMQGTNNSVTNGTTCFSCHAANGEDKKAYSHIYYSLKPLFSRQSNIINNIK